MASNPSPEFEALESWMTELLANMTKALFLGTTQHHAWLFYDLRTGRGQFVVRGSFTLNHEAMAQYTLPCGIVEIPPHFEALLKDYKAGVLRFDGTQVVAYGD